VRLIDEIGKELRQDKEETYFLFKYLHAMSKKFKDHIDTVADQLDYGQPNTILIAVLKIIKMTPFYTGDWKHITCGYQRLDEDNVTRWYIRIIPDPDECPLEAVFDSRKYLADNTLAVKTESFNIRDHPGLDAMVQVADELPVNWKVLRQFNKALDVYNQAVEEGWHDSRFLETGFCGGLRLRDCFILLKMMYQKKLLQPFGYDVLRDELKESLGAHLEGWEDATGLDQVTFLYDMVHGQHLTEDEAESMFDVYKARLVETLKLRKLRNRLIDVAGWYKDNRLRKKMYEHLLEHCLWAIENEDGITARERFGSVMEWWKRELIDQHTYYKLYHSLERITQWSPRMDT
jgi:hypothetical protein